MAIRQIRLTVNGVLSDLKVDAASTLLDVLRDELSLWGPREGCGMALCGACTTIVDGMAVSSCSYLAVRANGRSVTTIEGLERDGQLHPVQQAFLEKGAFQCSYCTPGMILSAVCLLEENPHPTVDDVKDYLAGNLCRCGAYPEIIEAVLAARDASRDS